MKFEVIKRSHVKRNILIGVLVVLILTAIILTFTRAKYKITESIPLVNGTINYELSDFNLFGAYIQTEGDNYTQVDEIPTSGYEFNVEKSYCTVNDENINATLNYDMETQTLSVVPLTTKGTKCYLYFDEQASGGDYILAGDNAPDGETTDWTGGTTYYYTGNPNNWVQFGGFWWRIIRINGDGTIRLIYNGTNATDTGTIGNVRFNIKSNDTTYVGFKYSDRQTHGTDTNSTILDNLNNWYQNNLLSLANQIDGNAGFCGDRRQGSGSNYAAASRGNSPSLSCLTEDLYTIANSTIGNKSLSYPIGLITYDEIVLAGGSSSYFNTGGSYWTMTPYGFSDNAATVFCMYFVGALVNEKVDQLRGVRPVINLSANASLTGSGTTTDPFVVVS